MFFSDFKNCETVDLFLNHLVNVKNRAGYCQNFLTFDTETTTIWQDEKPTTFTVTWQFATKDAYIILRGPEQVLDLFKKLAKMVGKTIIFVHNLHFDLIGLLNFADRKHFSNFFSIKNRPNRFVLFDKLEFRDSLKLTGMSLANSILEYAPDFAAKGDGWDYDKVRSRKTMLTEDEQYYAAVDVCGLVKVVEKICQLYDLETHQLPRTLTGHVRRDLRRLLTVDQNAAAVIRRDLTLTPDTYNFFKNSYRGGVSDNNPFFRNEIIKNVSDWDEASEYPAKMVLEKFPISTPQYLKNVKLSDLEHLQTMGYGWTAKIVVKNMAAKPNIPIPYIMDYGNGKGGEEVVLDGNRVHAAKRFELWANEIDFEVFKKCYTYDETVFDEVVLYKMGYLPEVFVKYVLQGFANKTKLKGLPDQADDYMRAKITVNSIYGIFAQNPLQDEYVFDFDNAVSVKDKVQETVQQQLDKYNDSKTRVGFYPWGVYVSSYAHLDLYNMMEEIGTDIVHVDTDSVKMVNGKGYDFLFKKRNEQILQKIRERAANSVSLQVKDFAPKTIKGETKIIGFWEQDETIDRFVTKRSKSYAAKIGDNPVKFTTAGIAAKNLQKYYDTLPADPMQSFIDNVEVPPEFSGKLSHLLQTDQKPLTFTDVDGNKVKYCDKYSLTLKPSSFSFNPSGEINILEILQSLYAV